MNSNPNQSQSWQLDFAVQREGIKGLVLQRVYNWTGNGYVQYGSSNQLWRTGPTGGDVGTTLGPTAVTYVGKASKFTSGAGTGGGTNFTNITNYQNHWGAIDGNTGAISPVSSGSPMPNKVVTYNRGHILPQQLGGGGSGTNNIFEQNAGQNNSNPWKGDENTAAKFINDSGDKYVYYSVNMS